MIAFGCAIGSEEKYRRFALPGIERVRDPEAPLIEVRGRDCLFRAYNEILDRAEADRRVEAIVLVHEDTEIRDSYFEERVRWALRDPAVAIVGTIGGVGVQGIDWWIHEYGVGYSILEPIEPGVLYETPLLKGSEASGAGGFGTVDTVDGYLLVFSRWAIHELRFDEREVGPGFHGYDADICLQARERGRKVFAVGPGRVARAFPAARAIGRAAVGARAHAAAFAGGAGPPALRPAPNAWPSPRLRPSEHVAPSHEASPGRHAARRGP